MRWMSILLLVLVAACKNDSRQELDDGVWMTTPEELQYPYYFPLVAVPEDNPQTKEGVALGRRLYYDPLLSAHGPFEGYSCSSCHHQAASFTTANAGASVLPHVNLVWSRNFLWKGNVTGSLEDIMRFEVDEFFQVDLGVLQGHPEYPALFKRAFGSPVITREAVHKALAQWFRRLISADSRFDRYLLNQEQLTDDELNGMMVFITERGDCFHCHGLPLMTDNGFHNIGLDSVFSGADLGRFLVTGEASDKGAFKAPTLRNVALTAPYMHDGRFETLEEVVEHYNSGVKRSPSLDAIMTKPGQVTELGLTPGEKADLVAFLRTLTDDAFVSDTALASPF